MLLKTFFCRPRCDFISISLVLHIPGLKSLVGVSREKFDSPIDTRLECTFSNEWEGFLEHGDLQAFYIGHPWRIVGGRTGAHAFEQGTRCVDGVSVPVDGEVIAAVKKESPFVVESVVRLGEGNLDPYGIRALGRGIGRCSGNRHSYNEELLHRPDATPPR